MKNYPHIRSAIYGQPWAITPEWLNSICEIYERHANADEGEIAARISAIQQPATAQDKRGYDIVNGVAVLNVTGPLFPKANLMTALSGATSYQRYSELFNDAMERPDVVTVATVYDTPGGSCLGLVDVCNEIYAARIGGDKKIISIVSGQCCSAGYMMASQADALFATEGSVVGSIGTLSKYDNYDRQERNQGNDLLVIRSSDLKAPGAGGQFTQGQIQAITKMVEAFFGQFKETVQRSRSEINLDKVATGEVWISKQAASLGLIDGISSLDSIIAQYGENILS